MITTYDLDTFSVIAPDESTAVGRADPLPPPVELRLQTVYEAAQAEKTGVPDYTAVIASRVLAGL